MAILLHIDTSTEFASVALSNNQEIIGFATHDQQKNHGAFLQPAIQLICNEAGISLSQINAVVVANGPGSYTGLRIGLSSAIGLCYALNIPLITISTLQIIAAAAKDSYALEAERNELIFCPMIDARRMEVFTALYDNTLNIIEKEQPLILSENSFSTYLQSKKIVFCGNGHVKAKQIIQHSNAIFNQVQHSAKQLVLLGETHYKNKIFANLAYTEPSYLKDFFMG
ncbi:MAG: tRNA (adenosine(37)-N6)-threonylcarbamoyltransferase complex dimerization subunit type 1 TsaB [Chitinophagaceae bacterium]